MRSLKNKTNVIAPSSNYPFGRIKDNPGDGSGTPVNEQVYGDIHQFFEKLMLDAGMAANNAPESVYDGFQLNEAFSMFTGKMRKKVVNIGAWNMSTTASFSVAHGLQISKIRSISGVVLNDDQSQMFPLTPTLIANYTNGYYCVTGFIDVTNVNLKCDVSGFVSGWSSASIRGWLVIEYDYS